MRAAFLAALTCCALLSACGRSSATQPAGVRNPGRFAGIGVFDAGRLWAQMTVPNSKLDAASARLEDDEHVIVVLDSHTGEVRQCGDHSGYCTTMRPWADTGTPSTLPVRLNKHASDLAAEDQKSVAAEAK